MSSFAVFFSLQFSILIYGIKKCSVTDLKITLRSGMTGVLFCYKTGSPLTRGRKVGVRNVFMVSNLVDKHRMYSGNRLSDIAFQMCLKRHSESEGYSVFLVPRKANP